MLRSSHAHFGSPGACGDWPQRIFQRRAWSRETGTYSDGHSGNSTDRMAGCDAPHAAMGRSLTRWERLSTQPDTLENVSLLTVRPNRFDPHRGRGDLQINRQNGRSQHRQMRENRVWIDPACGEHRFRLLTAFGRQRASRLAILRGTPQAMRLQLRRMHFRLTATGVRSLCDCRRGLQLG